MSGEKWYKKRWLWRFFVVVIAMVPLCIWLCQQYRIYFMPEQELTPYHVSPRPEDDTLRVAVIGDSWAEIHTNLSCDTIFNLFASRISPQQPVICISRGKGGAMSKEIYHFMFSDLTEEHTWEPDRCTQPLIEQQPDYCVVFGGINDVIFQRSTSYYVGNLQNIFRLLLHNNIRPVVMEIPMVDAASAIDYKPFFKREAYHLKAFVMGTRGNQVPLYRNALKEMLQVTGLRDSVLYISADRWNPLGWRDTTIFQRDRIHLNLEGYHRLDSCIVSEILKDWERRKGDKSRIISDNSYFYP